MRPSPPCRRPPDQPAVHAQLKAKTGAAKPPGTTGAPGAPAFPGAGMPFKKGGGRKPQPKAKPKTGGK